MPASCPRWRPRCGLGIGACVNTFLADLGPPTGFLSCINRISSARPLTRRAFIESRAAPYVLTGSMASSRPMSAEELVKNVHAKLMKGKPWRGSPYGFPCPRRSVHRTSPITSPSPPCAAGLDVQRYSRQLKDIASLFEPERSRIELNASGPRAGQWDMVRGERRCELRNRSIMGMRARRVVFRGAESRASHDCLRLRRPAPTSGRRRSRR
jgi:hypothetical protein